MLKSDDTKLTVGLFPIDKRTNKSKNEINDIKKCENEIKRKHLEYETNRYKIDFQQLETIRSFGDSIYNGKISIDEAEMEQTNIL